MRSTRLLFLAKAAVLLLAILVNAGPVEDRKAPSTTPLLTLPVNSGSSTRRSSLPTPPLTSKSTSTVISSATGDKEAGPIPTRETHKSASSSPPLDSFCNAFVKQCYKTALKAQKGEVAVAHSCQRNGGRYSTSYTYSCTRNGQKLTSQVLKALGWSFHRPSTTTVTQANHILTKSVAIITTVLDVDTKVTTSTAATTTSTSRTQVVDVLVKTVPSTVSSTTNIPYTLSSTTTAPTTQLSLTTKTVLTTTGTQVFIGTAEVPAYQAVVELSLANNEELIQKRAPSTFCLAFRVACKNECDRSSSRVDVEVCDASKSPIYTMACVCRNGRRQTQHALEAIAEDRRIVSITVGGLTSTTYTTYSSTTTLSTETFSTRVVTSTSIVEETSTSFTTSTATVGETIKYTGFSSAVETTVTTVPSITTTTVTYTTEVPTTTKLILAATGYVHAFDTTSGEDLGTIMEDVPTYFAILRYSSTQTGEPVEFMAMRDDPSGWYQLAVVGQPTYVLTTMLASESPSIMQTGSYAYAILRFLYATACDRAGSAPVPADPTSRCETFIFSPLALDSAPGATEDTVRLRPYWVNPTATTPANFSGVWGAVDDGDRTVLQVADQAAFAAMYPSTGMFWLTLRFPFST